MLDLTKVPQALSLSKMAVGAEWDSKGAKNALVNAFRRKKGCDLDLIAVLFQRGRAVRYAGWKNLNPLKDGTVTHTGDNTTGAGDGDDELVEVDLANLPTEVDKIVFMIGTKEKSFNSAENVSFNMYDISSGNQEKLAPSIWPELGKVYNALALCSVERSQDQWLWKLVEKFGNIQFNEQSLLAFANQTQNAGQ
jgi:tellurium resistance protein TerZ